MACASEAATEASVRKWYASTLPEYQKLTAEVATVAAEPVRKNLAKVQVTSEGLPPVQNFADGRGYPQGLLAEVQRLLASAERPDCCFGFSGVGCDLKAGERALEAGCGAGAALFQAAARCPHSSSALGRTMVPS